MGASFHKNENNPQSRRCDLIVYGLDGVTPAPRGTSFVGSLYISQSSSSYLTASGTLTNKRRPLAFADLTITAVDTAADNVTIVAHGLETGDGAERLTTTVSLPAPLAVGTDYWIIKDSVDKIAFATSLANAYANVRVDLTTAGTGTNKVTNTGTTSQRGLDGLFTYEATQAETNFDGSEFTVIIENAGFSRAFTTVMMGIDTSFNAIAEGAYSYGDLIRLLVGIIAGKVSDFRTGTQVYKSLDTIKTRCTVTTDASGRLSSTPGDLT